MMQDGPLVADVDWRGSRLCFLGRGNRLPFSGGDPAVIVSALVDGHKAGGGAALLRFIHNAVVQRHGPRRSLIGAGIVEGAIGKDGDRNNACGDNPCRISGDLKHGGGAELVLRPSLGADGGVDQCESQQAQNRVTQAGQELSSAI